MTHPLSPDKISLIALAYPVSIPVDGKGDVWKFLRDSIEAIHAVHLSGPRPLLQNVARVLSRAVVQHERALKYTILTDGDEGLPTTWVSSVTCHGITAKSYPARALTWWLLFQNIASLYCTLALAEWTMVVEGLPEAAPNFFTRILRARAVLCRLLIPLETHTPKYVMDSLSLLEQNARIAPKPVIAVWCDVLLIAAVTTRSIHCIQRQSSGILDSAIQVWVYSKLVLETIQSAQSSYGLVAGAARLCTGLYDIALIWIHYAYAQQTKEFLSAPSDTSCEITTDSLLSDESVPMIRKGPDSLEAIEAAACSVASDIVSLENYKQTSPYLIDASQEPTNKQGDPDWSWFGERTWFPHTSFSTLLPYQKFIATIGTNRTWWDSVPTSLITRLFASDGPLVRFISFERESLHVLSRDVQAVWAQEDSSKGWHLTADEEAVLREDAKKRLCSYHRALNEETLGEQTFSFYQHLKIPSPFILKE